MTTENSTTPDNSIVQYDRIEDAKYIAEKISNSLWSHIEHWSNLSPEDEISREAFLRRLKDAEERYLTFQRFFLSYLVASCWALKTIREKLESLSSSYSFEEFINLQAHSDEFEFCLPATGLLNFDRDMNGLFDRLVKSTLLYIASFDRPSPYTNSNDFDFSAEPLNPKYLSSRVSGISKRESEVIKAFTEACLEGFGLVASEREWEILHIQGCFSRRDAYNINQEVKMFKTKLRKPLFALLKQTYLQHSARKELLDMFKFIGKSHMRLMEAPKTGDTSCDNKSYLEFKELVAASLSYQDVSRIYEFDPKVRTVEFPHIVARILRIANWYVNRQTSKDFSKNKDCAMNQQEIEYLKSLASEGD